MSLEYRNILELWDRFENSEAVEMSLDFQGTAFSLKKGAVYAAAAADRKISALSAGGSEHPAPQNSGYPDPKTSAKQTFQKSADTDVPADKCWTEVQQPVKEIKAPLVGTFYRAPSPEAAPFVEIGQPVKKGDVVGIIEAMKLMNEILAEEDGVVEEILAEDASLVGFDEPLFRLK